jgi:isoquinoline 1-oxidoreductase beta subunit
VDVSLPGLLVATIAQCPTFGGRLDAVDTAAAEHVPGVVKVVKLDDAVAVVATGYWPAKRGLERLSPRWRAGERHAGDSIEHSKRLRQGTREAGRLYLPEGVTREQVSAAHEAGLARASLHLEALYEVPFLAHAPMEPMNATASVSAHGAELWVPTQYQSMVRDVTAEILHVPKERVIVHTTAVGGGFGRRTEVDYAIQAVLIAREVQRPVKLIWSREEDMSRGYFRPAAAMLVKGALDAEGRPAALSFAAACPSIMDYSIERRNGTPRAEIEEAGLATARDWPYAVPAQKIALASVDLGVPVTWMRSVGAAASVFALESFIDEMAAATQKDPLAYRRDLLRERLRELAVVERAASLAGWDRPPGPGRHRGFALSCTNGSIVAQVIEIELPAARAIRLHRVHCVVDCGAAMNPSAVVAQMEGGIIFGLSAAMFGEISLKDGAVEQKNFDRYPLLTLAQTPVIDVSILESDAPIGGVGEESVPPVAAALANALFAATGERVRRLPLARAGFTLAV